MDAVHEAEEQHNNDMSGLQRLQVPLAIAFIATATPLATATV